MNAATPSTVQVSHAHVAVKDRVLVSVQLPLVLMLPALLHPVINPRSPPRLAKRCRSVSASFVRRLKSLHTDLVPSPVMGSSPVRNRRHEDQLFMCSSRSFWSTFTRYQAPSNGFVCLAELQHTSDTRSPQRLAPDTRGIQLHCQRS